jgi:iron-sulfur cluster repair protein YtfE (RIC family)
MENEHNQAEETSAELRALARGDSMPLPASAATPTIAEAVARLDDAIQEQIYAESLVLFPRALALGCRDEHE